jgi:hypothetical protein
MSGYVEMVSYGRLQNHLGGSSMAASIQLEPGKPALRSMFWTGYGFRSNWYS